MNKKLLKQTGEWYLYHSYKNENTVFYSAIGSILTLFFKNGFLCALVVWVFCFITCVGNDNALNNDPRIISERERWMELRRKNGEVEEYKIILGNK